MVISKKFAELEPVHNQWVAIILTDLIALVFVFFTRDISILLNFPIYLLDPMRIMVMVAIMHSHRYNACALALLLPLFSYVISSHPYLIKTSLISIELILNILLFYYLIFRTHPFVAMLVAVVSSKVVYYGLKIVVVKMNWLDMEIISTPLWIQAIMAVVFGLYAWIVWRKKVGPFTKSNL